MYQCHTTINIVGSLETLREVVSKAQPLDGFTHEIISSETVKNFVLAISDFVFIDIENINITEVFSTISSSKKENSKIILCAAPMTKDAVINNTDLSDIYDIWIMPQSEAELTFRFRQLLKLWKTEKDYWLTQNYLDSTINSLPDLIWYKDKAGAHLKVNQSFCNTVNKTMEQIEGRGHYYIWDIDPDEYAQGEYICMESEYEVMQKCETCIFDEIVKVRNEFRRFKTYKSPLFDIDGSVMGTVGVAKDVTQEYRDQEEIIHKSNTDFLTGLYNRRYISQYIDDKPDGTPITAFYLDLDNFKSVNDTYGHKAGDDALLLTKDVLSRSMMGTVIARIGGDEFLIIDMTEYIEEALQEKCAWLEKQLFDAYQKVPNFHTLSASIGYAKGITSSGIMDELLVKADRSMYAYKKRKKSKQ